MEVGEFPLEIEVEVAVEIVGESEDEGRELGMGSHEVDPGDDVVPGGPVNIRVRGDENKTGEGDTCSARSSSS